MLGNYIYVLGGVLFSSLAQICLKQATLFEKGHYYWIVFIVGSISFYLLSFLTYYFAIKYFPISKISPIMTIGVVLIVVMFGAWTGETITPRHGLGLFFGVLSLCFVLS